MPSCILAGEHADTVMRGNPLCIQVRSQGDANRKEGKGAVSEVEKQNKTKQYTWSVGLNRAKKIRKLAITFLKYMLKNVVKITDHWY